MYSKYTTSNREYTYIIFYLQYVLDIRYYMYYFLFIIQKSNI